MLTQEEKEAILDWADIIGWPLSSPQPYVYLYDIKDEEFSTLLKNYMAADKALADYIEKLQAEDV